MSDTEEAAGTLEPGRLTPEEIRTLARNIVTGVTFCTNDAETMRTAFMVMITFGAFSQYNPKSVGAVYADFSEAGPTSVNGLPVFFSCKTLHREDLDPLIADIEQMKAALA